MTKEYKCECGRTFSTPSSVGGHKRHCELHLSRIGKLESMKEVDRLCSINSKKSQRAKSQKNRQASLDQWISEKHTCEKCGKVMNEKFGSGRFCSRTCSNSHKKSDESRIKLSEKLRGRQLTSDEIDELLASKVEKPKEYYTGPQLPILEDEHLPPGYFPRTRMSYAEKFWKKVLDNNKIEYTHDYVVHKPKGERGVFRIDFLIDNIDVEIDGQQHYSEVEIEEKDKRRDAYLTEKGFIVYRIRWINPINDYNKKAVNQQIDDLFTFLNKERIC